MSPLINKSKIRFMYYFICMLLARIIYITLMRRLSRIIRFKTDYSTYLYYGIMWSFLILGIVDARVTLRLRYLVFLISSFMIMAASCLCYEYSLEYVCPPGFLKRAITFDTTSLLNSFLFIIFGALIADYAFMMDSLHTTARIAMFGVIVTDILTILVLKNKRYDDMSYAYCVCLLTCTELFWFLEQPNVLDGILSGIGILSTLLCGTRGPVICILVLFLIWSFLYQRKAKYRIAAVCTTLVIVILFYTGILADAAQSLSEWLTSRDLPSFRILDMLQIGEITDDSGRGDIYNTIKEGVYQKLIFGYGIGGDRVLTDHAYAHNIFLEFFCHFGIFFGLLFLCTIGYYIICGVFDKDHNLCALSVILFAGAISKLTFSSSYILSPELFLLLGIVLNRPLAEEPIPEIPSLKKKIIPTSDLKRTTS